MLMPNQVSPGVNRRCLIHISATPATLQYHHDIFGYMGKTPPTGGQQNCTIGVNTRVELSSERQSGHPLSFSRPVAVQITHIML
jgi:hypothetical protein